MADKFELTDTAPVAPNGKSNVKWQSDTDGNISAYVEVDKGVHIIQDEGVALASFDTLNFAGAGVTASVDTPGARITVTIPGGAVASVFGRIGVVVAANGDYSAAQVTNAVSTLGSYADPVWISSLAYSKLTGVPSSFTPSTHVHAAADITTGVMAVARLGTGTPSAANYLRGDGAWTATPADLVTSVHGRTGAVVAVATDYTPAFIGAAAAVHVHSGADITTGTVAAPRLGSGTPSSSNFLRGDGSWQVAGGAQTPWTGNVDAANFSLTNVNTLEIDTPTANGATALTLRINDSVDANAAIRWVSSDNKVRSAIGSRYYVSDPGNMEFMTGGVGTTAISPQLRMLISSAGRVCIGAPPTDDGSYLLQIDGGIKLKSGAFIITALPSTNPGAGTKSLWYSPADSNRVYYAP